jgi:X-X-X-Leu-X-X-Gly heptad repeat protein
MHFELQEGNNRLQEGNDRLQEGNDRLQEGNDRTVFALAEGNKRNHVLAAIPYCQAGALLLQSGRAAESKDSSQGISLGLASILA